MLCPRLWRWAISGTMRLEKELRKAAGKRMTGRAMPCTAPKTAKEAPAASPPGLKPDGDEQVFDGGEPRAQVGAHRHGQRDAEQPSGQAVFGRALPAEAPAVPEVEDQRTYEGEPLGDHARAGDGEAGVFKAGRHQEGEADDREADLQKLLEDLRGGGFGPSRADGGKVTGSARRTSR